MTRRGAQQPARAHVDSYPTASQHERAWRVTCPHCGHVVPDWQSLDDVDGDPPGEFGRAVE